MSEPQLILASQSQYRFNILRNAGVVCEAFPARVDEESIKDALRAENTKARDIADALAEAKAKKLSFKLGEALVLGCDQILECEGEVFSKTETPEELIEQLEMLSGKVHRLYSAAVFYQNGQGVARHIERVEMEMRPLRKGFIEDYVNRNWEEIRHSVGGYHFEAIGAQLFANYRGDYFSIIGLPLLFVLGFLRERGVLKT